MPNRNKKYNHYHDARSATLLSPQSLLVQIFDVTDENKS